MQGNDGDQEDLLNVFEMNSLNARESDGDREDLVSITSYIYVLFQDWPAAGTVNLYWPW